MTRRLILLFCSALMFLFAGCGGGSSNSPSTLVNVTVAPSAATVVVGQTQTFTATVTGTTNTAVTWSVGGTGTGSIAATGVYTAPASVPSPATVTITATSQADTTKFGTATVTVAATASNVQVTVKPAIVSVPDFTMQPFTPTVTGSANTAVTWEVNGVVGGSQKTGFISSGGLYVAPSGVPTASDSQGNTNPTTVTVSAVSQADGTAMGSATVTIAPINGTAQDALPIILGTTGSNINDSIAKNGRITCCGGTLGSLVTRGGVQYILSNNHVLARTDAAAAGDAIVQPGLIDTGTCTTTIPQPAPAPAKTAATVANLFQFFNLQTGPKPNIDAAIAQVEFGAVDTSGSIYYLGDTVDPTSGVPKAAPPQGGTGAIAVMGMAVAKSGRSTGLTCSTIEATNISTSVDYTANCDGTGTKFTVLYTNQVGVNGGDFSGEGDSGSLIVTQDTATPVALLYAGSDTDTVGNPVADVLNFFKSGSNAVSFVGGAAHQVIGCSLPNAPASAKTVTPSTVGAEVLQKASATRDAHASELMAHPEVQALGVGASYDNPKEAAILFFVTQGQARTNLPAEVDGVRSRMVENALFAKQGAVSAEESAALEKSAATPQLVYSISDAELARAKVVHAAHVDALMKQAGVQGVGIGSSVDSPGEAALMIFTIRGVPQAPIPAVIDGLRTRVRESSRFRAGTVGEEVQRACKATPAKVGIKTATAKATPDAKQ